MADIRLLEPTLARNVAWNKKQGPLSKERPLFFIAPL
jgi:hypothetical protein